MTAVGAPPNGRTPMPSPSVTPPVVSSASVLGKAYAATRPRSRAAALAGAVGRGWRAFRPAVLPTAGCGCAAAAAYVAVGLWPGLLAAAAGCFLLDWLSKPSPPPAVVDDPGADGDAG